MRHEPPMGAGLAQGGILLLAPEVRGYVDTLPRTKKKKIRSSYTGSRTRQRLSSSCGDMGERHKKNKGVVVYGNLYKKI